MIGALAQSLTFEAPQVARSPLPETVRLALYCSQGTLAGSQDFDFGQGPDLWTSIAVRDVAFQDLDESESRMCYGTVSVGPRREVAFVSFATSAKVLTRSLADTELLGHNSAEVHEIAAAARPHIVDFLHKLAPPPSGKEEWELLVCGHAGGGAVAQQIGLWLLHADDDFPEFLLHTVAIGAPLIPTAGSLRFDGNFVSVLSATDILPTLPFCSWNTRRGVTDVLRRRQLELAHYQLVPYEKRNSLPGSGMPRHHSEAHNLSSLGKSPPRADEAAPDEERQRQRRRRGQRWLSQWRLQLEAVPADCGVLGQLYVLDKDDDCASFDLGDKSPPTQRP